MKKNRLRLTILTLLLLASTLLNAQSGFPLIDEDFGGWTSSSTIPSGWHTRIVDGTPGDYYWKYSPDGRDGNACAFGHFTANYRSGMLITKMINPASDQILRFWMQVDDINCNSLLVCSSSDSLGMSLNDTLAYIHPAMANKWQFFEVSLKGKTNSPFCIVFLVPSVSSVSRYYIDDVVVENYPGCRPVEFGAPYNVSQSSATLNWSYGTGDAFPGSLSITVTDDSTSAVVYQNSSYDGLNTTLSLSGLTAGHPYSVTASGDCSASQKGSSKSSQMTFKTRIPQITLPLYENFDSHSSLPYGWDASFENPAGSYINTSAANAHSGSSSLVLRAVRSGSAAFAYTPEINHNSADIQIDFWAKGTVGSTLTVALSDDSLDLEEIVKSYTFRSAGWQNIRFNTSNLSYFGTSTGFRIYFMQESGSDGDNITYIDDLAVIQKPTCVRPENLEPYHTTCSSTMLRWQDVSSALAYQVKLSRSGFNDTLFNVTSNPCTINGLSASTTYSVAVRTICSASDTSEWTLAAELNTPCPAIAGTWTEDFEESNGIPSCWLWKQIGGSYGTMNQFVRNTYQATYSYGGVGNHFVAYTTGSSNLDYLLVSKPLYVQTAGSTDIFFNIYRTATATSSQVTRVWANNYPDTIGAVLLKSVNNYYLNDPAEPSEGLYEYWANIPLAGEVYLMFEFTGVGYMYLDHIHTELKPACRPVEHLRFDAAAATDTSVTLRWDGGETNQWIVRYSLRKESELHADSLLVSGTPELTISGLQANTAYYASAGVRSYCSATIIADEVALQNVYARSGCAVPAALPWNEDFETFTTQTLGDGTFDIIPANFAEGNTPAGQSMINTGSTYLPEGSTRNLKMGNSAGNALFFVFPEFAAQQDGVRLKFQYRTYNSTTSCDSLRYGYITGTDTSSFVCLGSLKKSAAQIRVTQIIDSIPVGCRLVFRYGGTINNNMYGLFIDNISVDVRPTCPVLDNPSATTIWTSAASIYAGGQISNLWEVAYGVKDTPVEQMLTAVSDTGSAYINISNLIPDTEYDIYARQICSATNIGPWGEKASFRTKCSALMIAADSIYYDDFLWSNIDESIGRCYTQDQTSTSYYWRRNSNRSYDSDAYSIRTTANSSNGVPGLYRQYHLIAGHNYEIGAANYGYSTKYTVDCVFAYGRLPIRDFMTVIGRIEDTPANDWKYGKFYFSPDSTADYYVGFYGETSYGSSVSMYVDTLTIREMSCIPPEITMVIVSDSSATIGYANLGSNAEIEVATDPLMNNIIFTAAQPATANSVVITGLAAGSRYYYRMRLACSNDTYSAWTETDYFNTYCDAKPIPYSNGFDSDIDMICWSNAGTGSMERTLSSKHSGVSSMMLSNTMVYSPEFQVTSLASCELTGYVLSSVAGSTVSVGVSIDPSTVEGYEHIANINITQADVWQQFTVYFDLLNDTDYYDFRNAKIFAFVTNSTNNFYIDDVELHLAPSCRRPSALVASNVTDSCVTLAWTPSGTESSWVVDIYGRRDTVTTNPCTINRLIGGNDYAVSVAAICGAGEMSEFTSPLSFSTSSPATAQTPWIETFEDFTNQASLANGRFTLIPCNVSGKNTYPYFNINTTASKLFTEGGNKNLVLIPGKVDTCFLALPVMDAPVSQLVLSFLYANGGTAAPHPYILVGLMTDLTDRTTFRLMQIMPKVAISSAKSSPASVIDFSTFTIPAGYENAHIVFAGTKVSVSNALYCAYLDNISVVQNSSCASPFNLRTTNLLSTSADICFSDTANTQWQYILAHRGESCEGLTPVTVSDSTISLTGLTPASDYLLYVRSFCSAASQSPWSTVSFSTAELPVQLPYVTGFENGGSEWHNVQCTDDNFFVVGSDPAAVHTGSHALYVTDDGVLNHQGIHYGTSYTYIPVELNASKYEISFDWLATGGYASTVFGRAFLAPSSVRLATSNTGTAPAGLSATSLPAGAIALDGGSMMNLTDQWQHASNIIDLTNAPGGYRLVFYWRSTTSANTQQSPLAIDNVSFREVTCPMPEGLISLDSLLSDTTLAFHFTKPLGTLSEYRLSLSGNADDYIVADTTSGNMVYLTGLAGSQLYTLFVRNLCSDGDVSPWTSDTIRTACGIVTMLPLSDDFEISQSPCWTRTNLTPASISSNWVSTFNPTITYNGNFLQLLGSAGSSALNASPLIHFDGNRDYHVSFLMYTYKSATYNDKLSFYLSTDAASLDLAVKFYECTPYNADYTGTIGFVRYDVDLPAGTDGNYYFVMRGDYNRGCLYIDDLTIDVYPSCRELTNLPVADFVGDNFINVRISDFHPMWQYAWALNDGGVADTIGSIVTDLDRVTITGLNPGTEYSLYARAFCIDGDTTGWVPFGSYTTRNNSCFAPSRIEMLSAVCDTMASFSWLHGSGASAFSYLLVNTVTGDSVAGITLSDTLTVGGLTENTSYRLEVYTQCDSVAYGASYSFTTSYLPALTPYVTGFENQDENSRWVTANSKTNRLIIGSNASAVHTDSTALYVSSNPLSEAYSYSTTVAGQSFAYRILDLPAGMYRVQYDWKCLGEGLADYGRLFLLPADVRIAASNSTKSSLVGFSASSLPAGAIALDNGSKLNLSSEWNTLSSVVTVADAGRYNLVVAWCNDAAGGIQPPLAIDNLSLSRIVCEPLTAVLVTPADIFADAVFARTNVESDLEYGISLYNNPDSVATLSFVPASGQLLDTLRIAGLAANTQYYLFARSSCGEGLSSSWTVKPFTTISEVAPLPYVTGFEPADDCNWQYVQAGQVNQWAIGNAESMDGARGLYVSYGNGGTRGYDVASASVSFATRNFYLTPGLYEVSYDWKGYGESMVDYMRVVMLPASAPLVAGSLPSGLSATTVPANAIALDGGSRLNLSTEWQTVNRTFSVTESGVRKLVVVWRNDGANGVNPAGCIDNLVLRPVSCGVVSGVTVADVTGSSVSLTFVNESEDATGYIYAYGESADRSVAIYDTVTTASVQISALEPSTRYNLWIRTICSDTVLSSWYKSSFTTQCHTVTSFPFVEDFESTNGFPAACWQSVTVAPGNTYSGNWNLYEDAASTEHISSGTHSMTLSAAGGTTANNIIALPEMSFQSGHHYSLSFSLYRTASSLYTNRLNVWLGAAATDTATSLGRYTPYIAAAPAVAAAGMYSCNIDLPDTISGIRRILFQGLQTYSSTTATEVYVDDIRVNEWVEAPAFSDTVCGTLQDYYGFGFHIAARDIQPGLNTRTRRAIGSDAPDTLYTLNLYSYAPVIVNLADTICRGEVYSNGCFQNLTQAGAYQSSGLVAHTGCDSTVILQLYVVDIEYHQYDTICQGDSILFNNVWYKTQGIHTFDSLNSRGCTETTYLHLVVEQTFAEQYDTICEGESVTFHGMTYTATGTYDYPYFTVSGCAAIDRLNLEVVATNPQLYDTICQGQPYYYNGALLTASGTYQRIYVSPTGCDVTEELHLTVVPPTSVSVADSVCEGYPYYGYGILGLYISQDTVVVLTSKTYEQCDSVTEVHLHLIPTVTSEFYVTIARGEKYNWNDNDYTEPGDYTATFRTVDGCDSVVTLHLTVTTGISTVAAVSVEIVPNPVTAGQTSFVYVDAEVSEVEILNSFGQVVDTFVPVGYPIEVSAISASGIYYVRLMLRDGNVAVEKLIVK